MWWDRSELAEVYFSRTCVGVATGSAGMVSWFDTAGLDDGVQHLVAALTRGPLQSCGRVRVWLGSDLARPFVLSIRSGARTRVEAKALTTMLAPDATGLDGPVRVWANDWQRHRGGLAVVMLDSAWATLQDAVDRAIAERKSASMTTSQRPLSLISVRPWWNQVMNAVIEQSVRMDGAIGWSLNEARCVVHGLIDKAVPVEAGYDVLGQHDGDGLLMFRRLQVNWGAIASSRHVEFARQGEGEAATIGLWRQVGRKSIS